MQGGSGHAGSDYTIILFPRDPALRRSARRVKTARAGTVGQYSFADPPAGEYLMAALSDFVPDDLMDSTFLDSLQASAITVTLVEGQDKKQDLKIGG